MPPTSKKSLEDLLELQKIHHNKQELLEEELRKLNEKVDTVLHLLSNQQNKEQDNIKETIIQLLTPQHEFIENYKQAYTKGKSLKTKEQNLQVWGTLLKLRKMAFYHAIKSSDTASTYRVFLEMEEQFIPKKFREKINTQDTEEQQRIKKALNVSKLQAQIDIQEDNKIHFTKKYTEIDDKISTEIKVSCPTDTHQFLSELWESECKEEEEKSRNIVQRKISWLRSLPDKEKSEQASYRNQINNREQDPMENTHTRHTQNQWITQNRGKKKNTYQTQTYLHNRPSYSQGNNINTPTLFTHPSQQFQSKSSLSLPRNHTHTHTHNKYNINTHTTQPYTNPYEYGPTQYKPTYFHPHQPIQSKTPYHTPYTTQTNHHKIPLLNNPYQNNPSKPYNNYPHPPHQQMKPSYNNLLPYHTQQNRPYNHPTHQWIQSKHSKHYPHHQTKQTYNNFYRHKYRPHIYVHHQQPLPRYLNPKQLTHNNNTFKYTKINPYNNTYNTNYNNTHDTNLARKQHNPLKHTEYIESNHSSASPQINEINNTHLHFLESPPRTTIPD